MFLKGTMFKQISNPILFSCYNYLLQNESYWNKNNYIILLCNWAIQPPAKTAPKQLLQHGFKEERVIF